MYCIACKSIIEKQLKYEKAIKKLISIIWLIVLVIELDPALITKEEIKNILEKSGYKFIRVAR